MLTKKHKTRERNYYSQRKDSKGNYDKLEGNDGKEKKMNKNRTKTRQTKKN